MIKVLFLSAGTNACFHAIKTIREKFPHDFYIIGADINPQHLIASGNLLDQFYRVPYTNDPKYYGTIIDICDKEKIDFIIPSFDADQKLFYPENKELLKCGTKSLGTPYETLKIYDDKKKMNEFLLKNGLPIPRIFSNAECDDDVKYMVKPVNGVGSIGAGIKYGHECKTLNDNNLIIQELCSEPEFTLECFSFNKIFSCVCRERIATKSGVCTKARVFNNDTLEKIGKKFSSLLNTPTIFNLQFMKNKNNEYVITDVNLRMAGGASISYAAGWDEISAIAKIMLGHTDNDIQQTIPKQISESYVVRAYTDIVTQTSRPVVAFDLDGTILDSRKRHIVLLKDILKKHGMNTDVDDLIEFKRNGKNNIDFLISKGIDNNTAKEIQSEWIQNIEKPEYLSIDTLYPDALDLLNKYQRTHDLIIITARANPDLAREQIKSLGIDKYIKNLYVVPQTPNVSNSKADILIKTNTSVFIGDTCSDFTAARIANVKFIHRDCGFHNMEFVYGK